MSGWAAYYPPGLTPHSPVARLSIKVGSVTVEIGFRSPRALGRHSHRLCPECHPTSLIYCTTFILEPFVTDAHFNPMIQGEGSEGCNTLSLRTVSFLKQVQ